MEPLVLQKETKMEIESVENESLPIESDNGTETEVEDIEWKPDMMLPVLMVSYRTVSIWL